MVQSIVVSSAPAKDNCSTANNFKRKRRRLNVSHLAANAKTKDVINSAWSGSHLTWSSPPHNLENLTKLVMKLSLFERKISESAAERFGRK
ncbi:MAG: hypothetical protein ACTS4V_01440 [Candidatus Hodgkinia cicadicola]